MNARHPHPVASTTHTVEMAQIAELNARLAEHPQLTADQLGLAGTPSRSGSHRLLPRDAELRGVTWDGAPTFPTVHAVFASAAGSEDRLVVDLHTEVLRALGRHLGLRQVWGVGRTQPTHSDRHGRGVPS